MRQSRFKFFILILTLFLVCGLGVSCKQGKKSRTKKTYAKHRPPNKKKTHHTHGSNSNTHSNSSSNSNSAEDANLSPKAKKVITTAKSYLGTKYKYGGTTKAGMDCSGLICTSYQAVGVNLPRRSVDQSNVGKRIYVGQLQPGDLIFFATGSSKTKITHVGLVTKVEGNGNVTFIHSSSSRGVVEDNLSEDYYKTRYVKACRP